MAGNKWNCPECGYSTLWTYEEMATKGNPVCPNCDNDLRQEQAEPIETARQGHDPEYDGRVPSAIFDIEDSNEMAEIWIDEFGYGDF